MADQMDLIQLAVREVIENELSLNAWRNSKDTIVLQLMLGEERVGKLLELDIDWNTDHGHGGGQYVQGLDVKVVDP